MDATQPFDATFFTPFPTFAKLRQHAPAQRVNTYGRDGWLVTRFGDAVSVLKDPRFVPKPPSGALLHTFPQLLNTEGLDHRRLCRAVSKGFTPRFTARLGSRARRRAHELIDEIEASQGREFDLIEAFVFPLPMDVVSDILGLPTSGRGWRRVWSTALFGLSALATSAQEEVTMFVDYLRELFEHKRTNPGDDLISALVRSEEGEDTPSEEELIEMLTLLLFAGHETVMNLLSNSVVALLSYPAQLAKLRAQPELAPLVVEELLRLEGPVTIVARRYAAENIQLGEQLIHAGETVLLAPASANHDEAHFTLDDVGIARELNKYLAFAHSVHYCLGAPLARLEAQEALAALLERFPKLTLGADTESLARRVNPTRGLRTLPLRYG